MQPSTLLGAYDSIQLSVMVANDKQIILTHHRSVRLPLHSLVRSDDRNHVERAFVLDDTNL